MLDIKINIDDRGLSAYKVTRRLGGKNDFSCFTNFFSFPLKSIFYQSDKISRLFFLLFRLKGKTTYWFWIVRKGVKITTVNTLQKNKDLFFYFPMARKLLRKLIARLFNETWYNEHDEKMRKEINLITKPSTGSAVKLSYYLTASLSFHDNVVTIPHIIHYCT